MCNRGPEYGSIVIVCASRLSRLTLTLGKNLAVINQVDFPLAVQTIRYYAGWADKHAGQTIEVCIAAVVSAVLLG